MLRLIVLFIIFSRVLLGRKGHVQGNLYLLHLWIVEIHGAEPCLPPLYLVQICRDNIPQAAQPLPVKGGLQLLLLVDQLSPHPGELVAEGLMQALGLGPHPLRLGPAAVEVLQQLRKGGELVLLHVALILPDGPEGKIFSLPGQQQTGRHKALRQTAQRPVQGRRQSPAIQRRQIRIGASRCQPSQLPANQGGNPRVAIRKPAVQGRGMIYRQQRGLQRRGRLFPQIQFALRGRVPVEQPRQDLPLFGHLQIHPAQAVNDAAVRPHQNQVGVAAHELQIQVLFTQHPQLVGALHAQLHRPLHRKLPQPKNPAPRQMLSQQHTEHGGLGRIFVAALGVVKPGMVGRSRQQQLSVSGAGAAKLK